MLLSLRRTARKPTLNHLFIIVFIILLLLILDGSHFAISPAFFYSSRCRGRVIAEAEYSRLAILQAQFWHNFFKDLVSHVPKCDPLVHPEDTHLDVFYDAHMAPPRPDNLTVTGQQLKALYASHNDFLRQLEKQVVREERYGLPYIKGTRGIVTTAGGQYLPVAVVSIRMLRKTGSQLPIEVFLSSREEWDHQICGNIFPTMNARCVVLQEIFDAAGETESSKIDKYQYKIMSILFSSFEEVLFMDSDCFPVHDPEQLFLEEPFISTGLVFWPDFWFPSESLLFFEISGIEAPQIHTRPSTESGEILYSKAKHHLSLLLATYYNYYGPNFYYPLQSQGAPGEGDKETFYWAAIALQEPEYSVQTPLRALGYHTTKGEWRGSAMLQHDPIEDFAAKQSGKICNGNPVNPDHQDSPKTSSSSFEPHARPFFIHANFPKFDPATIFQEEAMGATGPTRDSDGTIRRVWQSTAEKAVQDFGFDLERRLWSEIKDMACEYEGNISAWEGKFDICKNATVYWDALFGPREDDYFTVDKI